MEQPTCDCGSGLSAARCCAYAPEAEGAPPPDDPAVAGEGQAAQQAFRDGDRAGAERMSLAVLERTPHQPEALAVLGEIRFNQGRIRAAAALLERLAAVEPGNFWPVNKLALLELGRGGIEAAERHARQGVRLAPATPQAHNLMGMVMTEAHRPALGEYHCRRALELSGRRIPLVLSNLATCLKNQGHVEEARALYREADALAPNNRQTLLAWAQLEEADRKLDDAEGLLDRLERLRSPSPAMLLVRAAILGVGLGCAMNWH